MKDWKKGAIIGGTWGIASYLILLTIAALGAMSGSKGFEIPNTLKEFCTY